jgi:hypothetical protein
MEATCSSFDPSGGARRDRTDDLMLAKHALSQLSYGPVPEDECFLLSVHGLPSRSAWQQVRLRPLGFGVTAFAALRARRLVGLGRLELPTSRLSSARSNQLSYKPLTRGTCLLARARRPQSRMHRTSAALARVRPRRKRNEDGEIPPMQLNDPDDRWPLMFQKRFDKTRIRRSRLLEEPSLERR